MVYLCNEINSKQPFKILFLKNLTAWKNTHVKAEKAGQKWHSKESIYFKR